MVKTAVALVQARDMIRRGEARTLRLAAPLSLAVHSNENGQCLPRGEHS